MLCTYRVQSKGIEYFKIQIIHCVVSFSVNNVGDTIKEKERKIGVVYLTQHGNNLLPSLFALILRNAYLKLIKNKHKSN